MFDSFPGKPLQEGPPAPPAPTTIGTLVPIETQVEVLKPPAPPPPPGALPPPPPPPTTNTSGIMDVQFFLVKVPDDVKDSVLVLGVLITFVGPIIPPLPAII
jgi:hypothetical protein